MDITQSLHKKVKRLLNPKTKGHRWPCGLERSTKDFGEKSKYCLIRIRIIILFPDCQDFGPCGGCSGGACRGQLWQKRMLHLADYLCDEPQREQHKEEEGRTGLDDVHLTGLFIEEPQDKAWLSICI